ncbi:SPOR domain-containing protein [Aurantiacibacter zhengii]|uniref:Sporulation protein n=1 Tax=Aurantiacibacter zhengii TaxID=2307003 RepID=A0A418NVN9_9SPHN|nr:SPOR domain-containing protein [Aurantiacibacter zhengii]RIV88093.1 sporulation protein [Aurantiacibacter zhengii]
MADNTRTVWTKAAGALGALAALALAAPLGATVRDGVDAWSRGDYAAAVAEWQGPAEAGDPDAMFNMGQAYRLGRGVPTDMERAEELYRQAALAGHLQAADTYGLMLFQGGRREEALPYVQAAATRGDPRAQYLIGIAHFNGDMVERDWERAYALLTLANGAGLPQAGPAIEQMDAFIPLEQRQSGAALARRLETEAEQARSVQLAAADLSAPASVPGQDPIQTTTPPAARPSAPETAPETAAVSRVPRPIPSVSVSPSVAAARDAVEQARQATGMEDPAQAGASYARSTPAPAPRPSPPPQRAAVAAAPPATAAAPAPRPAAARSGPWRVQLGAFGVAGNAERLWSRVSGRAELAGRQRLFLDRGRVTVVQAGGFASQAEAQSACSSLQRAGIDCLVTRN